MIYTEVGEVVSTNSPLRDEKGSLYEGGIRVPMIVCWPGVVDSSAVCSEPTTTADLLPTFCEMASSELPAQTIDGASLVPLLKGDKATLYRAAIYFHYPHYHHSRPAGAIREGDWKLIEFFEDGDLELYNLAEDVGESRNLAEQLPDKARELRKHMVDWRALTGARMPTPNPDFDPALASQWWNRRSGKPLDIEAMRRRYQSRTSGRE